MNSVTYEQVQKLITALEFATPHAEEVAKQLQGVAQMQLNINESIVSFKDSSTLLQSNLATIINSPETKKLIADALASQAKLMLDDSQRIRVAANTLKDTSIKIKQSSFYMYIISFLLAIPGSFFIGYFASRYFI